jgi:altronate hydrolase
LLIQEEGGTEVTIQKGVNILLDFQKECSKQQRVPMLASELIIGTECGGSDTTSALAANPSVGGAFDLLVKAGGTAIFEEVVELVGLKDQLMKRAKDAQVEEEIALTYDKMENYCKRVRQYSVSPGNFAGGLTTIEEKSLGSYLKSGTQTIQGVLKVSQQPENKGLYLLDSVPDEHYMDFGYTNPNDTEGLMDLLSCGAHILLYTTGRGSCTGSVICPVLKITGNPMTYEHMKNDMDFNAGLMLTEGISLNESSQRLAELVVETANGKKSKPEALGHEEYLVMYKHQKPHSHGCRLDQSPA